jgi:glycerate 2-kinase
MLNYRDYRTHLNILLQTALRAADPAEALRRHWDESVLNGTERIFIVGAGKAGEAMGQAAAGLVGNRLVGGAIAVPVLPAEAVDSPVQFIAAGHPHPNAGSLAAGEAIAEVLADTTESDLVIAVISGGGSALLDRLNSGFTLNDLQALTHALLRSGAPIQDLNCVRKHLSQIKGGGLARMAHPARLVAYILSDVINDPLDVIASGPTVPDPTTIKEAQAILEQRLGQGEAVSFETLSKLLSETPKLNDPVFNRVTNKLVGSNTLARQAAAEAARELGLEVHVPDGMVQGEASQWWAGVQHLFQPGSQPQAWIFGGEPTVTVCGNGKGGRNQELVLAAAVGLDGDPRSIAVASMGTDGIDGFSPAAGAIATPQSCTRAHALGLDPLALLKNNDSYSFFSALDDAIVIGPTGTNVNDVVMVLVY